MKLSIAEALSAISILIVGALGIALFTITAWYWAHGLISPVSYQVIQEVIIVEIVGTGFSFALSKGKPPLGFLTKKK
jgi:hypothetical protein